MTHCTKKNCDGRIRWDQGDGEGRDFGHCEECGAEYLIETIYKENGLIMRQFLYRCYLSGKTRKVG